MSYSKSEVFDSSLKANMFLYTFFSCCTGGTGSMKLKCYANFFIKNIFSDFPYKNSQTCGISIKKVFATKSAIKRDMQSYEEKKRKSQNDEHFLNFF